jgi:hypothetical protein
VPIKRLAAGTLTIAAMRARRAHKAFDLRLDAGLSLNGSS